jgi:hypothetical protein
MSRTIITFVGLSQKGHSLNFELSLNILNTFEFTCKCATILRLARIKSKSEMV